MYIEQIHIHNETTLESVQLLGQIFASFPSGGRQASSLTVQELGMARLPRHMARANSHAPLESAQRGPGGREEEEDWENFVA